MPKTIIMLHGAWVTPKCWDPFKSFFEAKGYRVIAPPWPGKEGSVAEQNASPSERLRGLGIKEIVDYYADLIRKEPEPPVLIGHSFGGLFVQMLLDRGLGSAGIAIDPAPPKGVFALYPTVAWALRMPLLRPWATRSILRWPFSHFRYAFVHVLEPAAQREAYESQVVPETARIFWQAAMKALGTVSKVNFKNHARAPLLIVAGGSDRIVPAAVNRANFRKYKHSTARTDFKEFPGKVHWIIVQPGWEEVAGYCEAWLKGL